MSHKFRVAELQRTCPVCDRAVTFNHACPYCEEKLRRDTRVIAIGAVAMLVAIVLLLLLTK